MTTKRILLLAALVAAAPRSAKAATQDMQPLFVTNVTGTLRVQQDLPSVCSDPGNVAVAVLADRNGRIARA